MRHSIDCNSKSCYSLKKKATKASNIEPLGRIYINPRDFVQYKAWLKYNMKQKIDHFLYSGKLLSESFHKPAARSKAVNETRKGITRLLEVQYKWCTK